VDPAKVIDYSKKGNRKTEREEDSAVSETSLSDEFEQVSKLSYGPRAIDKWVMDPKVKHALDALDIDPQDHDKLSDILDPQNDGQVPVLDLIDGIRRLRGFPRRSDIVCIDLMIRELQKMSHEHHGYIENVKKGTDEVLSEVAALKDQFPYFQLQLQRIESSLKPASASSSDPSPAFYAQ